MIRFFRNHALWATRASITGSPSAAAPSKTSAARRRGPRIWASTSARARPSAACAGGPAASTLRCDGGEWETFDEAVHATRSDVSLALLTDATAAETARLSRTRHQDNDTVLHAEPSVVPDRRRVRSSWNHAKQATRPDRIGLTSRTNRLPPIPQDAPIFPTLNPQRSIREEPVYDRDTFRHPVLDMDMAAAVARGPGRERRRRHLVLWRLDAQRRPRGRLRQRARSSPRHRPARQPRGRRRTRSRMEHLPGRTFHGCHGEGVRNAFAYVLRDAEADPDDAGPRLFPRPGQPRLPARPRPWRSAGRGARRVLGARGAVRGPAGAPPDIGAGRILLLAQPRIFGRVFDPVSFWLVHDAADALGCVVAKVTNTFVDRHSDLCHRDDLGAITAGTMLSAAKPLHVSPFPPVAGGNAFPFDIRADGIAIRIDDRHGAARLVATLTGPRRPLTDTARSASRSAARSARAASSA